MPVRYLLFRYLPVRYLPVVISTIFATHVVGTADAQQATVIGATPTPPQSSVYGRPRPANVRSIPAVTAKPVIKVGVTAVAVKPKLKVEPSRATRPAKTQGQTANSERRAERRRRRGNKADADKSWIKNVLQQ